MLAAPVHREDSPVERSMSATEPEVIFGCRPNLLVNNLAASLRFYSEMLGFQVGWRWSDLHGRFLQDGEQAAPGSQPVMRQAIRGSRIRRP
jgi:hypothetical protein